MFPPALIPVPQPIAVQFVIRTFQGPSASAAALACGSGVRFGPSAFWLPIRMAVGPLKSRLVALIGQFGQIAGRSQSSMARTCEKMVLQPRHS